MFPTLGLTKYIQWYLQGNFAIFWDHAFVLCIMHYGILENK